MIQVEIDEKKYGLILEKYQVEKVFNNLRVLYQKIWCEACYDPLNESTKQLAKELLPHISELNKILEFKK
jgi:protoheme ferro-lyase